MRIIFLILFLLTTFNVIAEENCEKLGIDCLKNKYKSVNEKKNKFDKENKTLKDIFNKVKNYEKKIKK